MTVTVPWNKKNGKDTFSVMDGQTLLRRNLQADLVRLTTAGSVDDGKSTLIGRLLSDSKNVFEDHLDALRADSRRLNRERVDLALLTDGLKAEREQGITIDVAYRYFSTPRRRFIIADTPGHVQYTRNMATGASTADLAVVLIDARQGVLTQSRRHGFIASLLGIRHVIVAINKMDLVDFDAAVFEAIRADYNEFATRLNISDLTYIPISALEGDNVVQPSRRMPWYRGMPFLGCLENIEITGDRNLVDFRFPVQYVNRPTHDFRGYCGSIASGVVRVGDTVMVLPSGRQSRVQRIVTFDGDRKYACAPQSVTLCLEDELDISRGDMLAHPGNLPFVQSDAEAMLIWMRDRPLRINHPYHIKMGPRTIRGTFPRLHYRINPDGLHREPADTLELNDIGRVDVSCFHPAVFDEYQRNRNTGAFVVIDSHTNDTLAGGMIIERTQHRGPPPAIGGPAAGRRLSKERSLVTADDRRRLLGQRPVTVWLTGLSGSGKSTVARSVERQLTDLGHAACILDGDNLRGGLCRDLGFSARDRRENIRRVSEVARLMNDAGLIVITAFISPYHEDRDMARRRIGGNRFVEVYINTPLDVCEARDPKGLYRKARAGQCPDFTGISAPYEIPENPDLTVSTCHDTPETVARRIVNHLKELLA